MEDKQRAVFYMNNLVEWPRFAENPWPVDNCYYQDPAMPAYPRFNYKTPTATIDFVTKIMRMSIPMAKRSQPIPKPP